MISQEAREAYANIAYQQGVHQTWKMSLRPLRSSEVVAGWEREELITKHYEDTVRAARKKLTGILLQDNGGDFEKAIDDLATLQQGA